MSYDEFMNRDESNFVIDRNLERQSLLEMIKKMNIQVEDIENASLEELQDLADKLFDLTCISRNQTSIEELFPEACKNENTANVADRQISIMEYFKGETEDDRQITITDYFKGNAPYIKSTFFAPQEKKEAPKQSEPTIVPKKVYTTSDIKINPGEHKVHYKPFNKSNSRIRKDK